MRPLLVTALCVATLPATARPLAAQDEAPAPPRAVVVILADDLGWGDVRALNPASRIPTPHLDSLADDGMTFTDAHSPSGVCTPTRYGLLTGRYSWRTRMKSGVLGGYSPPLLAPDRETLGTLLRAAGYRTAAVGKWHLGMTLPTLSQDVDVNKWSGDPGIDWNGVITDGPTHHGFDSYFGVTASLDMAPYVYVRDDRFTGAPVADQPWMPFPYFVRKGPLAADFRLANVLYDLALEAADVIADAAANEQRLFLYVPLTAPHKPTLPHDHFRGSTGLGEYGDFIHQVDWTVGRILTALEEHGYADDALVVATSDNGSYMYLHAEDGADHVDDPTAHGYRPSSHRPNGPWRGTKADVYEAGHRVPFFVRWPGRVAPGTRSGEPICHVDLFATLAAVVGAEVPDGAAEDSASLVPLLDREPGATRGGPIVNHSANGTFALRDGRWKAIFSTGSGGRERPKGAPFDGTRLFDLAVDPGETTDVAAEHPERVAAMTETLAAIRGESAGTD